MSENVITDDKELNSEFAPPKKKTVGSPTVVRRMIIILIVLIAITVVTALGYKLFSAKPRPTQPAMSVREIVDENYPANDAQTSAGTLQSGPAGNTAAPQSPQPSQTEFAIDPKLMELLIEIPYEQRQTRDALVYFDDRIDSLIALQPSLESLISIHQETTDSMEIRMLAIEVALEEIRDIFEADNTGNVQESESRPPFRLIAIDRWENQWNAVIELDGRIAMIQPKEIRAGWKLLEIIPSKASAVFSSNSGTQATLKVN